VHIKKEKRIPVSWPHKIIFYLYKVNVDNFVIKGYRLAGQVHITRSIDIPPLPSFNVQLEKKIEIPGGLKQRFQPFGAGK